MPSGQNIKHDKIVFVEEEPEPAKRAQKRSDDGIAKVLAACDVCPHGFKDAQGWRRCRLLACNECVVDQRAQIASWACPDGRFEAERTV